jgi:hypothetical protein
VSKKYILASAKNKKFGHPGCSQLGEGVLVVKINLTSPYEMVDWFNYFTANFWFETLGEYEITAECK